MPSHVLEDWLAEKFWIWRVWTRLTLMVLAGIVLARARSEMAMRIFMIEVLGGLMGFCEVVAMSIGGLCRCKLVRDLTVELETGKTSFVSIPN